VKRPMRRYRPDVILCRACGRPITGEVKMIGRDMWHVTCWRPEPIPAEISALPDFSDWAPGELTEAFGR
jgi:hypothetical protein